MMPNTKPNATLTFGDRPAPGTLEAIGAGCLCPFMYSERGCGTFWVSSGCPLHSAVKEDNDNDGNDA